MIEVTHFPGAAPGKESLTVKGKVKKLNNIQELHEFVKNNAWSPGVFEENVRKNSKFIKAHVLSFDVDGDLPLETAKKRLDGNNYAYSITLSKSHQKEKVSGRHIIPACDRFRITIPLAEPIFDKKQFVSTWRETAETLFPESDAQCKDPARFFFKSGSNGEDKFVETGKLIVPVEKVSRSEYHDKATPTRPYVSNFEEPCAFIGFYLYRFIKKAKQFSQEGVFNEKLNMAAWDAGRGNIPENIAYAIIEQASPHPLDSIDITTFQSGFKAGSDSQIPGALERLMKKKENMSEENISAYLHSKFKDKYVVIREESTDLLMDYAYLDNDRREVVTVDRDKISKEAGIILRNNFGFYFTAKKVNTIVDTWALYEQTLEKPPKIFALNDDPDYTYNRLQYEIKNTPTPVFDEFISRVANSDALKAWTWSLFDDKSDQSQYVWMYGAGGDGKSTFTRFLSHIMGKAAVPADSNDTGSHWTWSLIGARLVKFEDTNARTFMKGGKFKTLTGGDEIAVNPKGGKQFKIENKLKFIFNSNNTPKISYQHADLRRIIFCEVDRFTGKIDPHAHDKLIEEAPGILYKCREMYNKLTEGHGPIKHDESLIKEHLKEDHYEYEQLFKEYFVHKNGNEIEAEDFNNKLLLELRRRKITLKHFRTWLYGKHGVQYSKARRDGQRKMIYTNIAFK